MYLSSPSGGNTWDISGAHFVPCDMIIGIRRNPTYRWKSWELPKIMRNSEYRCKHIKIYPKYSRDQMNQCVSVLSNCRTQIDEFSKLPTSNQKATVWSWSPLFTQFLRLELKKRFTKGIHGEARWSHPALLKDLSKDQRKRVALYWPCHKQGFSVQ
jgi:hypothetical protein